MIDWAARARAQIAQGRQGGADETDETRLLSVSSVRPGGPAPNRACLSSVSSVATPEVVAIGADDTTTVVAVNDPNASTPLLLVRSSGNPYMTPDQGDECHACGWDDSEIETFMDRATRFALIGRADAEHLAERLTLRDRESDDRCLCLECGELLSIGRCAAALRGEIPGADRRLAPVQNILMRCSAFKPTVIAHASQEGNDDANHHG